MEKWDKLLEILYKWNFWDRPNDRAGVDRKLLDELKRSIHDPQVVVLQGLRRSGKSTLLFQLMRHLVASEVDPKRILYVNFEEPFFSANNQITILDDIYATYRENINPDVFPYLFFDEIQNINGWERWVRVKNELQEAKLFLTGSSAKLLSSEIASVLTGRHLSFSVWPLSFEEFLRFRDVFVTGPSVRLRHRTKIRSLLKEYLHFGGMPEAVLTQDQQKKEMILKQYFEDILFRDVVSRHQIRDVATLKKLAVHYITNIANVSSYNKIKKSFGIPIDVVRNYTAYLTESYLISEHIKFSFKVREQQMAPKKVYATDVGIRNCVAFRFSEDTGRLVENVVFNALRSAGNEVYYTREKSEVDFVVKQGTKITKAIQVSFSDLSDPKNLEREIRGLKETAKTYALKNSYIITDDKKGETKEDGIRIFFLPLEDFLLA